MSPAYRRRERQERVVRALAVAGRGCDGLAMQQRRIGGRDPALELGVVVTPIRTIDERTHRQLLALLAIGRTRQSQQLVHEAGGLVAAEMIGDAA